MFHLARWHNSGKLFVSQVVKSEDKAEIGTEANRANQAIADQAWPSAIHGRYFVWHADLSKADLEAHKPSGRL